MRSVSSEAQTDRAIADDLVIDENIDGIILTLQPGMTFSGRLKTAGSGSGPDSWRRSRLTVAPIQSAGVRLADALSGAGARLASSADDGTFVVTGIQPGDYQIVVDLPPSMGLEWTVQSIASGTRDLRDARLTFEQGSLNDVTITLTNRPSVVTGTLSSAAGTPAADYYVVLFPADRSLWHPSSPRVKVVRPGVDGVFSVRELPAGEYRMAALSDVEDHEWRSRTFLDSLLAASIAVTVRDGATTRQDVRIR
jgi:hypothetical protein